jgi:hypothetical protein
MRNKLAEESEKKRLKSAGKLILAVCLSTRSKPIWGSSNADLSVLELPASYCAEALLTLILKRLS